MVSLKEANSLNSLHCNIIEAEQQIRHEKVERGVIFSPNGNILWEKTGTKSSIDISEAIEAGLLKGCIFTHNHPLQTSFSMDDFKVFIAHGLLEMRAVDQKYAYSMSLERGLVKPHSISYLMHHAKEQDKKLEREYQVRLSADPDDEMYDDYAHEWFRRISEVVPGFMYTRTSF